MARISDREELFVVEYLIDFDRHRAAEACGYKKTRGTILLKKPAIIERIEQETAARRERLRVDADRITLEFAKIAFANPKKYYPKKGEELDMHRLTDDEAAPISEYSMDEQTDPINSSTYRRTKFKLHDKISALNSLARSIGMMKEDGHVSLEYKYSQMTAEERLKLAGELLKRGERYLIEYDDAVKRGELPGEIIEHEPQGSG